MPYCSCSKNFWKFVGKKDHALRCNVMKRAGEPNPKFSMRAAMEEPAFASHTVVKKVKSAPNLG